MSGIKIVGTGLALPQKVVSNEALSKTIDTSDEWIFSRTGIHSRYIAGEGENVYSLAKEAAQKAIEKAAKQDEEFSKEKIKAVFAATMTSDHIFPSVACMLQKELGLEKDIKAFDISAACTGFVYALQTAYGTFCAGCEEYILVLGAECMSSILNFQDRSTCVLFGDGAGAAILKKDHRKESCFLEISGTEGNDEVLFCEKKEDFIHMNGGQVYRFATKALRGAIQQLLEKSQNTMDDIDYLVCHQANARIIDSVKRKYPGQEEKFFMNMEHFANTSAASVAIAMADMYEKEILKPGMKIITAAFGAGLSWSGILMTI